MKGEPGEVDHLDDFESAWSLIPSSQKGEVDKVLLLSLRLLFKDRQEDIVDELTKLIVRLFPIESMIIFTKDGKTGNFVSSGVFGYPPERLPMIKEKVTYTSEEIQMELGQVSRPMGRFSRLYPAELFKNINEKDTIETLHQDRISTPRLAKDDWHPLDRASFYMIDRSGEEIGYFYITSTTDGKMLSEDTISGLDILASVASVAMEITRLKDEEQVLLSVQERRAAQMSQILAVASSVLLLADTSKLIDNVLKSIDDLFGFKAISLTLYDEVEKCFKWVGFSGYSEEQIARARKLKTTVEIVESDTRPEYRIGYLAYFKPAEKKVQDDMMHYFAFKDAQEAMSYMEVPRKTPDSWHQLDDLAFLVQDRVGRTIGVIYVDMPIDGKIPSREVIELVEIFVSLVAIALENSHLYSEAQLSRDGVHILNRLMFHDLMNYSMAIRGYLDLAALQRDENSSRSYLGRAMKQIDQTAELIEKVRKLSAIRSADKKNLLRIDLARTISMQFAKTSQLFSMKAVKSKFEFEREDAFVMANDLLPDLFHNIFMNAIKFDMHDVVEIDVGLKEIPASADPSGRKYWRVSVADRGPGILDERKKAIFTGAQKPSSREPARGMGLGLSIVKSLVDLYGGKVWVEDRERGTPDKGAVFYVQLPQA